VKKKRTEDELFADLRAQGEDEMRRRWREAERRGVLRKNPHRAYFLKEVQTTADYAKPANMRRIRDQLGEREAEFRQGLAQEALRLLKNPGGHEYYRPSKAQAEADARAAIEWAKGQLRR
jgi:hypothetical protein